MGFLSAFNTKTIRDCHQVSDRLAMRIGDCLQRLENRAQGVGERCLTLIARSPSSEISRALALQAETLERQDYSARMIFARLAPIELAAEMASSLKLGGPNDDRQSAVRVIKNPALLNAHEQLVIGETCCWTGDLLRRSEGNRNGLDIWEEDSRGAACLARFAFNAMWRSARPVPARVLSGGFRGLSGKEMTAAGMAATGQASRHGKTWLMRTSLTQH